MYKGFITQDTFSDRLILFLFHFAFFLKAFKKDNQKKILQDIYDYTFKQLELSIREIGYGDVAINKKMKNYLNIFHSVIEKINNWEKFSIIKKEEILYSFFNYKHDKSHLIDYFDNYYIKLKNSTLNSYTKGVINHKF